MMDPRPDLSRRAAAIFLSLLVFAGAVRAANVEISSVEMNVSNLDRLRSFYSEVLQFTPGAETREPGRTVAAMRLGEETLLLAAPDKPGRPIPAGMRSNDRLFQHLAIVVSDIDAAYRLLVGHGVAIVSSEPQTLPGWNYDAAGTRALYFRDPDGHFLELIQFPSDKGEPKWQRRDGRLFLGFDHTAVGVRDMKKSIAFYRDLLGLTIEGQSLNYGGEQELLSGVPDARVSITSLRGVKGPGIELLQYEKPGAEDISPGTPGRDDLLRWQINLRGRSATEVRDPDGHTVAFSPSPAPPFEGMREAFRQHWTRYLMEGAELGIFMVVALYLTIALEHPSSPLRRAIGSGLARRFILGIGIGVTVVGLIYCQWGRQSGAQFNPAVTLARLSIGRIEPWDAFFYIIAQFIGGWLLLVLAGLPCRRASSQEKVKWVVTQPGKAGTAAAFAAEFFISFLILFSLLLAFHFPALKPWIGVVAGLHLCAFITFEAPFSGMSLNPARSVASALPAREWKAMWVYFIAPPLGMLLAARLCRWMINS